MEPTNFVKFSAATLEEGMRQHKIWQHDAERALIEEIIDEVQALPARAPRKSGRLFDLLPGHVQGRIVTDLERKQRKELHGNQ
jgi:hypothetical protein